MLSRLALLWSCLAGARYITKGDGNGLESPHYCTVKALLLNRRAALCNCEILPSLVRCGQIVSGFVKSCQIASGHVSVFDCFLLWLCLAVYTVWWLFFVVKTKAKALPVLLKNVRLDVAMWNLEARLQKRGGIGLGGMLKAESCVVLTSHEKMSLPKVRTIMHLDSFENFTFQLWPMHLPQSSLFNLYSPVVLNML